MSKKKQKAKCTGFVANPAAVGRGGPAIQAARGIQQRGLLERLAQAEIQQLWQQEIAARSERKNSSSNV